MTKKRVRHIEGRMNYPVGDYMHYNLPIIKSMYDRLKRLYPTEGLVFYCTGSSGAIISGILASMFKNRPVYIAHVKKDGENSHSTSNYKLKYNYKAVIIDDFVASGKSVNRVYKKFIEQNEDREIDCLCVSGSLQEWRLKFKPQFIIRGNNY